MPINFRKANGVQIQNSRIHDITGNNNVLNSRSHNMCYGNTTTTMTANSNNDSSTTIGRATNEYTVRTHPQSANRGSVEKDTYPRLAGNHPGQDQLHKGGTVGHQKGAFFLHGADVEPPVCESYKEDNPGLRAKGEGVDGRQDDYLSQKRIEAPGQFQQPFNPRAAQLEPSHRAPPPTRLAESHAHSRSKVNNPFLRTRDHELAPGLSLQPLFSERSRLDISFDDAAGIKARGDQETHWKPGGDYF